jgi:quercetin dioxygenase-like cupin family protein
VLEFDLDDEAEALRHEHGWRDNGHSAKTLVKHQDQRTVLIAMKRGTSIPRHRASGAVSILVLSGCLRVQAGRARFELPSGSLLALDRGLPHDVEATKDSSLVLTVSARARKQTAPPAASSK